MPAYFCLIKTIVILGVCWDEEVINRSGNTEKKTRKWLTWNSGDSGCLISGWIWLCEERKWNQRRAHGDF